MSESNNHGRVKPRRTFSEVFKREAAQLAIERCDFASRQAARSVLFEWMELFYNQESRHSALGYLSPLAFERRAAIQGEYISPTPAYLDIHKNGETSVDILDNQE